jgi:alcohol dehydrogenase
VDDKQADLIADMAVVDPSAGGNPLPMTRAGAAEIFDAAFHGRL